MEIIEALRREEAKLENRLTVIRGAIKALNGQTNGHAASSGKVPAQARKRRMSAEARARISRATKARWTKFRAEKAKSKKS